jgi:hypothetical protein
VATTKTNVTFGYLFDDWSAGHQVEETTRATHRLLIDSFIRPVLGDSPISLLCRLGPRPFERLYAELRVCGPRCHGREFVEHRTLRPHECNGDAGARMQAACPLPCPAGAALLTEYGPPG